MTGAVPTTSKPKGLAEAGQPGQVAFAAAAEAEALAHHDHPRAHRVAQHLAREVRGALPRQLEGERQHGQPVDADRGQGLRALVQCHEGGRRAVGAEDARRMRIEGQRHRGPAARAGLPHGLRGQRLVPEVDAVEVPHRHGGLGPAAGGQRVEAHPLHGARG
jgi:hypothetical protein